MKPTLKKVSKYENKFAKLQKKAAEFNFRNQLKQVKKKEFTLEEEDKEVRTVVNYRNFRVETRREFFPSVNYFSPVIRGLSVSANSSNLSRRRKSYELLFCSRLVVVFFFLLKKRRDNILELNFFSRLRVISSRLINSSIIFVFCKRRRWFFSRPHDRQVVRYAIIRFINETGEGEEKKTVFVTLVFFLCTKPSR